MSNPLALIDAAKDAASGVTGFDMRISTWAFRPEDLAPAETAIRAELAAYDRDPAKWIDAH